MASGNCPSRGDQPTPITAGASCRTPLLFWHAINAVHAWPGVVPTRPAHRVGRPGAEESADGAVEPPRSRPQRHVLVLLGLLWPHIRLPNAWGVTAVALIVYSAYANWLATLLAAAWGAGRRFAPIAAADHEASAAKERVVSVLLVSLSVSIVLGVGIVIIGL